MAMKRICVYCGSSPGTDPDYLAGARALGRVLAENNLELVYGGARVGLMGAVADATLAHGGTVIGVIPRMLNTAVAHEGLTTLHITDTMHERKTMMFDLADGFIAMPGGLGTLEELFEVATWAQMGSHSKPCGLLNIRNYYDKLIEFLGHTADQGFVHRDHLSIISYSSDPGLLLDQFRTYRSPADLGQDKLSMFARNGGVV
jgi:hypothetical protein